MKKKKIAMLTHQPHVELDKFSSKLVQTKIQPLIEFEEYQIPLTHANYLK
jgi:hypothetical protein